MATKFLSQKIIFSGTFLPFFLDGLCCHFFAYFFEDVFKITISPQLGVGMYFFQNLDRPKNPMVKPISYQVVLNNLIMVSIIQLKIF